MIGIDKTMKHEYKNGLIYQKIEMRQLFLKV